MGERRVGGGNSVLYCVIRSMQSTFLYSMECHDSSCGFVHGVFSIDLYRMYIELRNVYVLVGHRAEYFMHFVGSHRRRSRLSRFV